MFPHYYITHPHNTQRVEHSMGVEEHSMEGRNKVVEHNMHNMGRNTHNTVHNMAVEERNMHNTVHNRNNTGHSKVHSKAHNTAFRLHNNILPLLHKATVVGLDL